MSFRLYRLFPIIAAIAAFAAIWTASPASADTTAPTPTCGNVNLGSTSVADANRSFDCFTAAFQHCDQTVLTATGHEADSAVTWTFITVSGGRGCAVSETVERLAGGTKTTDSYLCNAVSNEKDGLHFNDCGPKGSVTLQSNERFSSVLQPLSQSNDSKS
jgi:hypothetical protein